MIEDMLVSVVTFQVRCHVPHAWDPSWMAVCMPALIVAHAHICMRQSVYVCVHGHSHAYPHTHAQHVYTWACTRAGVRMQLHHHAGVCIMIVSALPNPCSSMPVMWQ